MKRISGLGGAIVVVVAVLLPTGLWAVQEDVFSRKDFGELAMLATTGGLAASTRAMSTGETLSHSIDIFTQKSAVFMGEWIMQTAFLGISWFKLAFCLALLLVVFVFERLIRYLTDKRLKVVFEKYERLDAVARMVTAVGKPVSLFVLAYGIFWAISPLYPHFRSDDGGNPVYLVASKAADLIGYIAIFWLVYSLISLLEGYLCRKASITESELDDMLVPLIGKALRIFIIILGAAVILHSMTGLDLGPMLASLGIGGVAIAFAAKDSIANLLGSMTIIFDKPFSVGERIIIDGFDGTVEEVGFRSTRIRTLAGNLVSIPNEKIINTVVENVGRRPHIRWLTNITLTYDTPPDKVEKAVTMIREILRDHEGMQPDFPPRVYFNGFNDWSLNILVVAWYHPPDYWQYTDWLQRTCLAIMRAFEAEGIDFAFPTQSVYLAGDDKRQLKLALLKGDLSV